MNGRVTDAAFGAPAPFPMFEEPVPARGGARLQTTIHQKSSSMSDLFFSARNVDALQQGIRYRVYVESGGRLTVGRQSDVELGIVMRSVFLQEGTRGDLSELEQVRALNAAVLAFCVPQVVKEAEMYLHFRRDVSTLPVPLDRGQIATTKGDRSLEMKPFM